MLDYQHKLLPRKVDASNPYDHFLRLRWNFVKTKAPKSPGPPPRSDYPQYFFYCAFIDSANHLLPDQWMNDVGEKIPMWFESARLYRDYTGDEEPLKLTKELVDYSLQHGITSENYSWPNFPQSAADAGATEFRGFTGRFKEDDIHVDHAGDIGSTYFKMYLLFNDVKYRDAAINVGDVLADKVMPGTASESPWPYVVDAKTGKVVSEYGTNWFGCIRLLNMLIDAKVGNTKKYSVAVKLVGDWLLKYPFVNGKWVDGHTDTYITGTTNLSNLSASNAGLYLSDHLAFSKQWKFLLPSLIKWTEENFVFKTAEGEPSQMWGANIVSEQVAFMPKMDYQTARYAAQCAKWYRLSGDESFKEKAVRSLNFVTYCNDTSGKAYESPFSKGVNSWWSDSYGECPIMFYHALAAMPELAPSRENHILYSSGVLKNVSYEGSRIDYTATEKAGTEYMRLTFEPLSVTISGKKIKPRYSKLENGDYYLTVERTHGGVVAVSDKANR